MLAGGGLVDDLVLEDPGEVVRDEDGVQAGGERGVDVGLGAVADHPGVWRSRSRGGGEGCDRLHRLFRQDFDGGEVRREAGAVEFVALLGVVAFGDQDAAVAAGEVGEGLGDAGEELDLLVGDGLREADDAGVLLRGDGVVGELLEAGDQRLAKALEAVAVGRDGGAFEWLRCSRTSSGEWTRWLR